MTKEEYILLYEKCASGNCTKEEQLLLQEYKDDFLLNIEEWDSHLGNKEVITKRMHIRLMNSISKQNARKWYRLSSVAASILILLSIGLGYFYLNQSDQLLNENAIVNDIVPGSKKATLILEDGSQLILDDYENGVVANERSFLVSKREDGELIYSASTSLKESVKHHSIVVPLGGEYRLTLSDGTKVWLNSGSSLRYPVSFIDNKRTVELKGEAYFEVAENTERPFHVLLEKTEIEVLGTHFNVNSYSIEDVITLVEGSVKLKSGDKSLLLKPGQSGIVKINGEIGSEVSDIESVISWKNGYFVFRDKSLKDIMDKVSRWYNIEVEYEGGIENKKFYAKIARYDDFLELLKNIELTGIVHFKIEGRRVIAMH